MLTLIYFADPKAPKLPAVEGITSKRVSTLAAVDAYGEVFVTPGRLLTPAVLEVAQQHYMPVLAVVADTEQAAQALAAGADDYLLRDQLDGGTLLAHRVRHLRDVHPIQQIIQASPDGVLVVNTEGVIRFANQTARRMFGREGLVGTPFGFPVAVEGPTRLDLITPSGVKRYIEMRANAITWRGEACYLAALRDVSEHVALTKALEEARRQAETANSAKDMLLMSVNHELRTPLTSIKGFSSTLLADDVTWSDAEWEDFVGIIFNETVKLEELINQLLDYSEIRSGALSITLNPTSMGEIVTAAQVDLSTLAADHTLQFDIPPDLPPVSAHAARISQVLANLVANAARYGPPGSTIRIEAQAVEEGVKVTVSDKGPGIPPRVRGTLFDPFVRDDDNTGSGVGLGLAIVKSIIEAHRGRVWVQATSAEGTTIAFVLPTSSQEGATPPHAAR